MYIVHRFSLVRIPNDGLYGRRWQPAVTENSLFVSRFLSVSRIDADTVIYCVSLSLPPLPCDYVSYSVYKVYVAYVSASPCLCVCVSLPVYLYLILSIFSFVDVALILAFKYVFITSWFMCVQSKWTSHVHWLKVFASIFFLILLFRWTTISRFDSWSNEGYYSLNNTIFLLLLMLLYFFIDNRKKDWL